MLVKFTPERWGALDTFQTFCGTTYTLSKHDREALSGAANNFAKALRLERVSRLILPRMEEDRAELDAKGYSSSERSKEYTAVVEALIISLYSSLDCTRKVLRAIYPKAQGLPDSTRKLFANAAHGSLDPSIPVAIRETLASATWYAEFRVLRDALTHSNVGSCHLDPATGKVTYLHETFRGFREPSYIDDFASYIWGYITLVSEFLVAIYNALTSTLKDDEVWAMCGMFYGRIYSRFVRRTEAVDFNGGRCDAFSWFELDENPTCPFVDSCQAYKRRTVAEA